MSDVISRVYVAGAISPYPTDPPVEGYWENITRGMYESKRVMQAGFLPYNPFLDFLYYCTPSPEDFRMTEGFIKQIGLGWVEACDAILVLKKYRKSEGTKAEIKRAKELRIPVFYSLESLIEYAEVENGEE